MGEKLSSSCSYYYLSKIATTVPPSLGYMKNFIKVRVWLSFEHEFENHAGYTRIATADSKKSRKQPHC